MTPEEKLRSQAAVEKAAGIAGGYRWLSASTGIGVTRLHNCKTGKREITLEEALTIQAKTGVAFAALRPDAVRAVRKGIKRKTRSRRGAALSSSNHPRI